MFCRLWLLNAGILASNAAKQLLLIAVSQIVLYCVKRCKDTGKQKSDTGISLCPLKRGRRCIVHHSIVGNIMVYQDRVETNFCSYSRNKKIQNGFQSFLLLFWGQFCCWTETKISVTICLFFISFLFPQLLYCFPWPTVFRRVWKEAWVKKKHGCQQSASEINAPSKLRKCQYHQNRRQKVFNRGVLRLCAGGFDF